MKATLLKSSFYLLSVFSALGFAAYAAGAGAPAGQNGAPKQTKSSADSKIEIENWAKPEPGWLYVLDPNPDAGGLGGRVWLFDPETAKVMGSIRTGDNPDFALSPDGSRLYVASITEGDSSELAVIDTAAGAIVQRSAVEDREVGDVIPSFSTMAVSGDGLALRIVRDTPKTQDADMFLLATFDTTTGEFLPNAVHLYNCGPARFVSHATAEEFDVLCPRTNRIRLIRVDAESHELQNTDIKLPWDRRIGVAEAIEPAGNGEIGIVRGDGGVFVMNADTHEFADTAAHPVLPNRIPPATWPVSPDGSRIYLGYISEYDRHYDNRFYLDYGRPPNLRPDNATAGEFRVLDTHTWKKIGTIKTKMPFWSAVIANDGKMLYAMAPQKHSILVIDTGKMRQIRILKVGGAPTLALVAP
jgi:DNA-binding beta-propeller fold protein YncE